MLRPLLALPTALLALNCWSQALIDRYLTDPLTYTNIVGSTDQVSAPRDLDFKPHTNELWVMNRGTSAGGSFVIVHDAGLPGQTDEYRKDTHSGHFMIQASAMAFSPNLEFAAVNEVQNTATPTSTFMGPALWNSDLNIFATVFQNNWETGRPLGSHIDMLHQSPFAMGIASDSAKVYWVMDGHNGNICRYDFVQDHGPGYDYHGAGKIWRYTDVPVTRVANIPSHMILDRENGWLYFIDGGAKQVKRMNVHTGAESGNLTVPSTAGEPLAGYKRVLGATVEVVDTWTTQPCGIEYSEGRLLVSDHTNGDIRVYDVTGTPTLMGTIATGQASIMGLKIGPDGRIWFVNNSQNKVVRIDPVPLDHDAAVVGIVSPAVNTYNTTTYSIEDAVCGESIEPVVTIRNNGAAALNTLTLTYGLDEQSGSTYTWSGSLAAGAQVDVSLPGISSADGAHVLWVSASQPNDQADLNVLNDRTDGYFRSVGPVEPIPYQEGFDQAEFPPQGWHYVHFNPNNYMSRNASVGGFGVSSGCLKMDHYSGEMDITGQLDYMILPRLDLSNAAEGTPLEFAVAHRQYNASSADRLMVKASSDCGGSWVTLYDKQGATLSTAPAGTSTFTPNATQWRAETVDLGAFNGQDDVLLMFVSESAFGNNVYVDDVRVGVTVGMEESFNDAFSVHPNPTLGMATIHSGTLEGELDVRVFSVDGALVIAERWVAVRGAEMRLDLSGMAQGSYVVDLSTANGEHHREVLVVQ